MSTSIVGKEEVWVDALYMRILGRKADAEGKKGWVEAARNARSDRDLYYIALGFTQSPEHREEQITGLYDTMFGRAADPEGLAYWVGLRRYSIAQIEAAFAISPEFFERLSSAAPAAPEGEDAPPPPPKKG